MKKLRYKILSFILILCMMGGMFLGKDVVKADETGSLVLNIPMCTSPLTSGYYIYEYDKVSVKSSSPTYIKDIDISDRNNYINYNGVLWWLYGIYKQGTDLSKYTSTPYMYHIFPNCPASYSDTGLDNDANVYAAFCRPVVLRLYFNKSDKNTKLSYIDIVGVDIAGGSSIYDSSSKKYYYKFVSFFNVNGSVINISSLGNIEWADSDIITQDSNYLNLYNGSRGSAPHPQVSAIDSGWGSDYFGVKLVDSYGFNHFQEKPYMYHVVSDVADVYNVDITLKASGDVDTDSFYKSNSNLCDALKTNIRGSDYYVTNKVGIDTSNFSYSDGEVKFSKPNLFNIKDYITYSRYMQSYRDMTIPDMYVCNTYGGTCTINYTYKSYNTTLNPNGGTLDGSTSNKVIARKYNELLDLSNYTPIRTGYTFNGWYTAQSGGSKVTSVSADTTSASTYYAHWTENTYTDRLYNADNSTYESKDRKYTSSASYSDTRSKTGYTFRGWNTVSNQTTGTLPYVISAKTDSAKRLYPAFSENTYNVYVGNGYTGSSTSNSNLITTDTRKYTAPYSYNTDPTRTGYTFKGWSETYGASGGSLSISVPANTALDKTYYATWSENTYTDAIHYYNYKTLDTVLSKTYDRKYTESADYTSKIEAPTGYYLHDNSGGTYEVSANTASDKSFDVYVLPEKYNDKFEYISTKTNKVVGTSTSANVRSYANSASYSSSELDIPTGYQYYTFEDTNNCVMHDGVMCYDVPANTKDARTIKVYVKPIEYSITYNLDGGTLSSNAPHSYTIEDDVTIPLPEKTDYYFDYWETDDTDSLIGREISWSAGDKHKNISYKASYISRFPVLGTVTSTGGTYGDKLSNLSLQEVREEGKHDYTDGTFAWKEPDKVLNAGTHTEKVVFTPNNTEIWYSSELDVEVTINKAHHDITFPNVVGITYHDLLDEGVLTGGTTGKGNFTISGSGTYPNAGTHNVTITFTPDDIENYFIETAESQLEVRKYTPVVSEIGSVDLVYPEKLTESVFNNVTVDEEGTLSLVDGEKLYDAGDYTVEYEFTPNDTDNINKVVKTFELHVDKGVQTLNNDSVVTNESQFKKSDGKISGLPDEVEYRKKGTNDWKAVGGSDLENLTFGKYELRIKGNDNYYASNVIEKEIGIDSFSNVDFTDINTVKEVVEVYNNLSDETKATMPKEAIRDAKYCIDLSDAYDFVQDHPLVDKVDSAETTESVGGVLDAYDKLSDNVKAVLDQNYLNKLHDLENDKTAYDFTVINGLGVIQSVNADNTDDVGSIVDAYDKLSDEVKAYLDGDYINYIEGIRNNKTAYDFTVDHAVGGINRVTADNTDDAVTLLGAYEDLPDEIKIYIPDEYKNYIKSVENNEKAYEFTVSYKQGGIDDVTEETTDDAVTLLDNYDSLPDEIKACLSDEYKEYINNIRNDEKAYEFTSKNKEEAIKSVTKQNRDEIKALIDDYDALTDDEKSYISDDYKGYIEVLRTAYEFTGNNPEGGIESVNVDNTDDVGSIVEAYDKLSEKEKSYLTDDYKDYIEGIRNNKTAYDFTVENTKDGIESVNAETTEDAVKLIEAYDNLTDKEKSYLSDEYKAYIELVRNKEGAYEFITKNESGGIQSIDADNTDNAVKLIDSYDSLSDDIKACLPDEYKEYIKEVRNKEGAYEFLTGNGITDLKDGVDLTDVKELGVLKENYDSLPETVKELIPDIYRDLIATYDFLKDKEDIKKISSDNISKVEALLDDYSYLSDAVKDLLSDTYKETVETVADAYAFSTGNEVPDDIDVSNEETVKALLDAYNKLPDNVKETLSESYVEKLKELQGSTDAYDYNKDNTIQDLSSYSNIADAESVVENYDKLSDEAKTNFSEEDIAKIEALRNAIEAAHFEERVEEIEKVDTTNVGVAKKLLEDYDSLDDAVKEDITTEYRERLKRFGFQYEAAVFEIKMPNDTLNIEKLTSENKDDVVKLIASYDALKPEVQAKITTTTQKRIGTLKDWVAADNIDTYRLVVTLDDGLKSLDNIESVDDTIEKLKNLSPSQKELVEGALNGTEKYRGKTVEYVLGYLEGLRDVYDLEKKYNFKTITEANILADMKGTETLLKNFEKDYDSLSGTAQGMLDDDFYQEYKRVEGSFTKFSNVAKVLQENTTSVGADNYEQVKNDIAQYDSLSDEELSVLSPDYISKMEGLKIAVEVYEFIKDYPNLDAKYSTADISNLKNIIEAYDALSDNAKIKLGSSYASKIVNLQNIVGAKEFETTASGMLPMDWNSFDTGNGLVNIEELLTSYDSLSSDAKALVPTTVKTALNDAKDIRDAYSWYTLNTKAINSYAQGVSSKKIADAKLLVEQYDKLSTVAKANLPSIVKSKLEDIRDNLAKKGVTVGKSSRVVYLQGITIGKGGKLKLSMKGYKLTYSYSKKKISCKNNKFTFKKKRKYAIKITAKKGNITKKLTLYVNITKKKSKRTVTLKNFIGSNKISWSYGKKVKLSGSKKAVTYTKSYIKAKAKGKGAVLVKGSKKTDVIKVTYKVK